MVTSDCGPLPCHGAKSGIFQDFRSLSKILDPKEGGKVMEIFKTRGSDPVIFFSMSCLSIWDHICWQNILCINCYGCLWASLLKYLVFQDFSRFSKIFDPFPRFWSPGRVLKIMEIFKMRGSDPVDFFLWVVWGSGTRLEVFPEGFELHAILQVQIKGVALGSARAAAAYRGELPAQLSKQFTRIEG